MGNNPRMKTVLTKLLSKNKLSGFLSDPRAFPLLAFLTPLIVRILPEVLMGPYVVGFDTLAHYVPNTLTWLRDGVGFWNFLAGAPLIYVLLMGSVAAGIPIVISLKVIAPLLLGFLGIAVYFYAYKTLSWSAKKSLLVALLATLYFVALRVSWDMLRSEIALIFLFITLIFLKKEGSPFRNGLLLSLAMLMVVFAHQLVAVIMFVIVLASTARLSLDSRTVDVGKLAVCTVPAVFLFAAIVYAAYVASSDFSIVSGFPEQTSEGFMSLFGFASYSDMVSNLLGFLVFAYLPLLPLVILGFKRFRSHLQMNAWVLLIALVVLSVIVSPNASIAVLPYRWVLFLTYPLAFFAVEGFAILRSNWHRLAAGLLLGMLTLSYVFLPNNLAFPYLAFFPLYVPTSMLQNTVPLSDCQDTVNALQWTNSNMSGDARLLVHPVFYGWASITLNRSQLISYGYDHPEKIAQKLVENGPQHPLYLIWWINGSGWHNEPTVSTAFTEVYESGRIAIFMYNSSSSSHASDSEQVTNIKS